VIEELSEDENKEEVVMEKGGEEIQEVSS